VSRRHDRPVLDAQQRLCSRFRSMAMRKNVRAVVVTAIARELAGFVWAEMTADTA
jgi:hypothetical protein